MSTPTTADRLARYTTPDYVRTDGTAARIVARLQADGLTRHAATFRRGANGKPFTETFWAYPGTVDEMAAGMAANRKATLIGVVDAPPGLNVA